MNPESISSSPLRSSSHAQKRLDACAQFPIIRFARISIELTSPMHIGSGSEESDSDAGIVYDGNGLAAIPGSSIKGVLRHAYKHLYHHTENDIPPTTSIFGGSPSDEDVACGLAKEDIGGRITVSWGRVHNSENQPVDFPLSPEAIREDPVLNLASQPELRDHVKLNHRGTAVSHGKFDELIAAPGLRFTFSLEFRGTLDDDGNIRADDQTAWNHLLMLFSDHLFRFGGKSRRGFGSFKVIAQDHRTFRLDGSSDAVDDYESEIYERTATKEWDLFKNLPVRLNKPLCKDEDSHYFWHKENWLDAWGPLDLPHRHSLNLSGTLTPEDHTFWMIAGQNANSPSDSAPLQSAVILWEDYTDGSAKGKISTSYIIPGSALKGSLRHRTAFHYRRLTQDWASASSSLPSSAQPSAIDQLFGFVRARQSSQAGMIAPDEVAQPGVVYIDDILSIEGASEADIQNHVAIDRVLGGAMDHFLYDDQPLSGGIIQFHISIKDPNDQDQLALKALIWAIDDLCHGRLSLGAHSGRGYGFFKGGYNSNHSQSALTSLDIIETTEDSSTTTSDQ